MDETEVDPKLNEALSELDVLITSEHTFRGNAIKYISTAGLSVPGGNNFEL